MPTYEYICEKCGKQFEVVQKITSESFKTHYEATVDKEGKGISCDGKVKRIITGCNFILKGTHNAKTKSQKKVDESLKRMGIEDESKGWKVGE